MHATAPAKIAPPQADDGPRFVPIPIDEIDPSAFQARTAFVADGLDDLVESIRECGVINPLTLREKADGRYEIICGERRLRAARVLKMREVPGFVVHASDLQARITSLAENFQREDLNPLDKANGLIALRQELAAESWCTVARRVGLSKGRISQILSLLTLPQPVLVLVAAGRLDEAQVRVLRVLSRDDQELVSNARLVARQGIPAQAVSLCLAARPRKTPSGKVSANTGKVMSRVKKAINGVLATPLEQGEQHALMAQLDQLSSWCQATIAEMEYTTPDAPCAPPACLQDR